MGRVCPRHWIRSHMPSMCYSENITLLATRRSTKTHPLDRRWVKIREGFRSVPDRSYRTNFSGAVSILESAENPAGTECHDSRSHPRESRKNLPKLSKPSETCLVKSFRQPQTSRTFFLNCLLGKFRGLKVLECTPTIPCFAYSIFWGPPNPLPKDDILAIFPKKWCTQNIFRRPMGAKRIILKTMIQVFCLIKLILKETEGL